MGGRKIFWVGLYFWAYVLGMLSLLQWTSSVFYLLSFSILLFLLYTCIIELRLLSHLAYAFFFGVLIAIMHEQLRHDSVRAIQEACNITGIITDVSSVQEKPWLSAYTLSITSIDGQSLLFSRHIKCTIPKSSGYQLYDEIMIEKKSCLTGKPQKSFDYFLAKEGLSGWIFVLTDQTKKIGHKETLLQHYTQLMRQRVCTLYHCLSEPARTLYGSIFLGIDKIQPNNYLKTYFNRWGIVHYLARSGLHIMIFVMVWRMLFYYFFGVQRVWFYFVLPFVCLYAFLTPGSISFLRGVWSFLFLVGALCLQRPYHLPHLLVSLAVLFLLYNPYSMFFLDFQLSFGLTYALLCIQEAYYAMHVSNKVKRK